MEHSQGTSGRRVLVKFGGNALSGEGDLERFGQDISSLLASGFQPILVHGGGPEISMEMERRGLKVKKVSGLRVTDDDALQVAAEVLSKINSQVVDALTRAGVDARGMAGSEKRTVTAEKMPPVRTEDKSGHEVLVDLGSVGEVAHVDPSLLEDLLGSGIVPVIYPICADKHGSVLNVNADTVAAHVARAAGAREMVLVTDVPGILSGGEGSSELIPSTTLAEIDHLIEAKVITGGMVPKVEACRIALLNGVRTVYMLNGKEPHSLIKRLVHGQNSGTMITVG
jgi:acetylglutamate kinase